MTENKKPRSVFDLDHHTYRLMLNEPFFCAISRRVQKVPSFAIPTAGVRINESGYFEMLYNPEFFEGLEDKVKLGVLKHEFYHLIFLHVCARLPEEGLTKMWNIATDLAINSHLLDELPEFGCIPGVADTPFADYPVGLSAERYMAMLRQHQKDNKDKGKGKGDEGDGESQPGQGSGGLGDVKTMDDHSGWGENELSPEAREVAEERLRQILQQAADEASNPGQGWGSVPSEVRKEIQERLKTTVDWRNVLRYFVKASQRAKRRSTIKRINRRYPYIHAGKRSDRVAKVAVSIDQSGSVSDSMLAAFFGELEKLAQYAEFTVIPFDTDVAEEFVFVWKKDEKKTWERVRCGGTCFDAPTRWVNDRSFDGHIILTDMEARKPIASKCQRMWLTDQSHADRPYFQTPERVIAINP